MNGADDKNGEEDNDKETDVDMMMIFIITMTNMFTKLWLHKNRT